MITSFFSSAIWQLLEKFIRMPSSLLISILVANYLGAQQFGALSAAHAIVLLGAPFASFGLDNIVYQKISNDEDPNKILFFSIVSKLFGALLVYLVIFCYSFYFVSDAVDQDLILTLGFILFFSAFSPIDIYLQATKKGKQKSIISLLAFFVSMLIKIALVYTNSSLFYFSLAILIEVIVSSILLGCYICKQEVIFYSISQNFAYLIDILRAASPLLVSQVMIIAYTKIDIIMIKNVVGDVVVGNYVIATKFVEIIAIFPSILIASIFPAAISAKRKSVLEYKVTLENILSSAFMLGLLGCIFFIILGDDIFNILFSNEYSTSSSLINILCWASLFQFFGSFSTYWLVNEGLQKYRVYRVAFAMILNVILNYIWIPVYGAVGAAYATLISQLFASFIGNSFTKNTQYIFYLQARVLFFFPYYIFRLFLVWKNKSFPN